MAHIGENLNLTTSDMTKLGGEISDILDDLEQDHAGMFEDLKIHSEWYDAVPAVKQRTLPWEGASNVVLPVVRIASDNIIARLFNLIFATNRTWIGNTQNEDFADFVPQIVDYLNWTSTHDYDLFNSVLDWFSEMVPLGSSVLALNWRDEQKDVLVPGSRKPQRVVVRRGVKLEHVPREFMLWNIGRTIKESEVVAREFRLTPNELAQQAHFGQWDQAIVKKVWQETGANGPSENVQQAKESIENYQRSTDTNRTHDVREVWLDWPLVQAIVGQDKVVGPLDDSDRLRVPLVVTLHRKTREVLRVVAKPYFIPDWPFYDLYLSKRSGRGSSPGIAKKLEHLQRAMSTMVNQGTDSLTLANSFRLISDDNQFLKNKWHPNKPMFTGRLDSVRELKLGNTVLPDIQMMNILQGFAERVTGIGDPLLGQETRMGGHPSPATSTLALIQESNKLFAMVLKTIRRQLTNLGTDIATLYQQFDTDPDGRIKRVFGAGDAAKVQSWLFPQDEAIFGNLELDLHSLSETMNPEAEMQRAISIDQLINNYWAAILQMLPALEQLPPDSLVRGAIIKTIEAKTQSMTTILENARIDEIDKYLLELKRGTDGGIREFERFANNAGGGQAGGNQGSVQGQVVGSPAGAAGGLPPGLPQGVGSGGIPS